jgi:DNA-binding IclR family transcriptional regulator
VRSAIGQKPEGATVRQIAEAAKTSTAYAHDVVGKLVEAGEVRRENEMVFPA